MNGTGNYERVDGEVTLNGIYYNYVERKISQDTIYLKCLPNSGKSQFLAARAEFSKSVNGLNDGPKSSSPAEKKINLVNEYNQPSAEDIFAVYAFIATSSRFITDDCLIHSFIEDIYRPPQA
ncbi:MAG: hypothetical protein ACRC2O_11820 [Chitinophagaceae bacterium]